MSCPVTRDTELRKLSYHQLHQIARQMNHNKDWQNLMMILPKDLDQDPLTSSTKRFKYTQEHMRMIEEASSTGRRLPAQILFDEWGSSGRKRPNLGHLLDLLVQANLYRAADYLAVDILKENPPERPITGPAAAIDIGSLLDESANDLNFDSQSITFNGTSPQQHQQPQQQRPPVDLPVISGLFGSGGLVSKADETSTSNAPNTISTNLESDPVLEGLSEVELPNLSIFMNAAAAATTTSQPDLIDMQSTGAVNEANDEDYDLVYQSNVPNISLFGGHFLAQTDESTTIAETIENGSVENEDSSTPPDYSSTSVSIRSESPSSSSAYYVQNSLPQLSFLMNNAMQLNDVEDCSSFVSSSNATTPATAAAAPKTTTTSSFSVQKFNFEHLLNCTNNFEATRQLGVGGFGTVYMALQLNSDFPTAAVKRLHKKNQQNPDQVVAEKFELEIKVLSQHRHPNLVGLLGYADDCQELCLVYEFVAAGNLEQRLGRCRGRETVLTVQQRLEIALGVARAIDYLHAAKLIHRDVKSANVLLTEDNLPKLCDFGLLRPLNSRTTTMAVGSSGYMAPEIVRGTYDYEKVDVFAFGVLQLELLTGQPVVCEERREDLVSYVEKVVGNAGNIRGLLDAEAGDWSWRNEVGQRWFERVVVKALELSPNRRSGIVECLRELEEL